MRETEEVAGDPKTGVAASSVFFGPKTVLNAGGLYSPALPPKKLQVLPTGEAAAGSGADVAFAVALAAVVDAVGAAPFVAGVTDLPKDQFVLVVNLKPVPASGATSEGGFDTPLLPLLFNWLVAGAGAAGVFAEAKGPNDRGLTEKALGTAAAGAEGAALEVAAVALTLESDLATPPKLRDTAAHFPTLGVGTRFAGGAGGASFEKKTLPSFTEDDPARLTDTFLAWMSDRTNRKNEAGQKRSTREEWPKKRFQEKT